MTTNNANATQVGGDHYKGKAIQPWDYIVSNSLGYLEGNIVKYVSRWKDKGGIEDLRKARHYLDKLIETVEQDKVTPAVEKSDAPTHNGIEALQEYLKRAVAERVEQQPAPRYICGGKDDML